VPEAARKTGTPELKKRLKLLYNYVNAFLKPKLNRFAYLEHCFICMVTKHASVCAPSGI
jgi:hypothetical protein